MRRMLLEGLARRPLTEKPPAADDAALAELAVSLERTARRRLGRSLAIREVDAGSCNGCEKFMRSTTPSTILSASGCASSPHCATPTCCW